MTTKEEKIGNNLIKKYTHFRRKSMEFAKITASIHQCQTSKCMDNERNISNATCIAANACKQCK